MQPKFTLGAQCKIVCSCEIGQVVGRAEYLHANEPSYLLRYTAADGRAVESWWTESALVAA